MTIFAVVSWQNEIETFPKYLRKKTDTFWSIYNPAEAEVASPGLQVPWEFLLFASHNTTNPGAASGSRIVFDDTITHGTTTHIIAWCHPNLFHLLFAMAIGRHNTTLSQTIQGIYMPAHFRKESGSFCAPTEFLILGSVDEEWHKGCLILTAVKEM